MTIVTLEHALKFAVVQYLDRLRLQRGATVEELESAVQILRSFVLFFLLLLLQTTLPRR